MHGPKELISSILCIVAHRTTSNKERLKEQLVPFGEDFPLVTAAEARAFEASGWGYKD